MEDTHFQTYSAVAPSLLRDELSGKSVLVTGGGYGVGAAIAESFAEAGIAEIILVGRTESRLKEQVAKLSSSTKATIRHFVTDVSSRASVENLFARLDRSPDILINNAGYMAAPANFIEADLDDYWKAFEINVYGSVLVTQKYLQHRRRVLSTNASPAVVITVNTIGAYTIRVPNLSSYSGSKAALARWSESMVQDIPESTARFIGVHPGAVETDMATKSGLGGIFTYTDSKLAGDFIAWASSAQAAFLNGRFVWVNWDVKELVSKKHEIVEKDLLRTALSV